jgi:prophage regulatory protein
MPIDRILRPRAAARRAGIGRTTLYREIQRGTFPRPIRLSARLTGWPESTIAAWLASRPQTEPMEAERSGEATPAATR